MILNKFFIQRPIYLIQYLNLGSAENLVSDSRNTSGISLDYKHRNIVIDINSDYNSINNLSRSSDSISGAISNTNININTIQANPPNTVDSPWDQFNRAKFSPKSALQFNSKNKESFSNISKVNIDSKNTSNIVFGENLKEQIVSEVKNIKSNPSLDNDDDLSSGQSNKNTSTQQINNVQNNIISESTQVNSNSNTNIANQQNNSISNINSVITNTNVSDGK